MIELKRIIEYFEKDLVFTTLHAAERLKERGIKMKEIREAVKNGEIIEQYPEDFPYPSCLILGVTIQEKYLHIVLSDDGEKSQLITAYIPSKEKWNDDLRTRREK